jgi:hypothetical protein
MTRYVESVYANVVHSGGVCCVAVVSFLTWPDVRIKKYSSLPGYLLSRVPSVPLNVCDTKDRILSPKSFQLHHLFDRNTVCDHTDREMSIASNEDVGSNQALENQQHQEQQATQHLEPANCNLISKSPKKDRMDVQIEELREDMVY